MPNYLIRELTKEDLNDRSFWDTLLCLSPIGSVEYDDAVRAMNEMSANKTTYVVEVEGKIVSTASIMIERKFTHNLSKVAHIEDVVTHKDYRFRGYAGALVEHLIKVAKQEGCRKLLLSANNDNVWFYQKVGLIVYENAMRLDLEVEPSDLLKDVPY